MRKAFARKLRTIPKQMKLTLTYDQGKEMSAHRLFTKETGMQVSFAHPRSPWERGTNENTNGLIRQYFPKGTDFNQVSAYHVRKAQDRLNGPPRNVLNWKTPFEVFNELFAIETREHPPNTRCPVNINSSIDANIKMAMAS